MSTGAFVPLGRDLDWGDELPFVAANHLAFVEHPFPLDLDELDAERERVREAVAKKRPCGFAPWPEEQSDGLRRVA